MRLPPEDELRAIESIARRHVPACFSVVSFNVYFGKATSVLPEQYVVELQIRRNSDAPEPGGWGHALATELRAGWAARDFQFSVHQLASTFDDFA